MSEFYARRRSQPFSFGVRVIDAAAPDGFHAGDAIQISGPGDSGKTFLLLALAARLATEEARDRTRVDVTYFDMDGRVPLHRLANCIHHELLQCSDDGTVREAQILECLSHVSICYCPTPLKLVAALARERARLHDLPSDRRHALVVDGLGSSFWADKAEFAHTRRTNGGHVYDRVVQLLLDVARPRKALLAVGTREVFDARKDGVAPALTRAAFLRVQARSTPGCRGIQVLVGAAKPRTAGKAPLARQAGEAPAVPAPQPWVRIDFHDDGGTSDRAGS